MKVQSDLKIAVESIKRMTANNHHTDAMLVLARYLNSTENIGVLNGINTIHLAKGYLPYELMQLREKVREDLENIAYINLTTSEFKKLMNAF